ncbi:Dolichyl-phosphate-mannose-protein mannosyltransferase [Gimesia panareensis]|uniref:Dolichyl-phosphate-mannose-protein mannosyltransferase n=1 Tax=Gimesia panareensis TaxID=2527978 RepID=A0A518FX52_9PLAN|nr:glycosyltransferase family 39 protein [Gimesia panareensis]QDV20922.1 Dolichyl-phosphate-mannose-protein mannosyltransferase [Gimesia panareensis]
MSPLKQATDTTTKYSRAELITLVVVLLAGCLARGLFLSDVAVEHFDEGVYASNLWFSAEQGAEYPGRYYYAPPLLPFLIEWSMIFFGSGAWGVFLPSLLLGCLTVLLMWWVGRSWFGPSAGLVAALLAGGSDLHLLYSRTALTDVALGFFLLLSVYLIWRSWLSLDWKWPLLAGFAIGLAWSVKYNGWLPLAIGFSGIVPWLWFHRRDRLPVTSFLARAVAFTVVAVLVWSPVLVGLQKWGGYSVVASNHNRYVLGFSGWFASCTRQLLNLRLLEGPPGYLSLGLVCLVCCLLGLRWREVTLSAIKSGRLTGETGRSTWNTLLSGALAALPLLVAWLVGITPTLAILAAAGILLQLFFTRGFQSLQDQGADSKADPETLARDLATWLLAAWFCGLLLATPLYYPYPRLTIPWTMSAWLGIAALAGWLEQQGGSSLYELCSGSSEAHFKPARVVPALSLVGVALLVILVSRPWSVAGWQPRNDLATISRQMRSDLQQDLSSTDEAVLYIYAEPGLFFNLKAQGHQLTGPVADFQFLNSLPSQMPVYLIAGPHAARDPEFAKQFDQVRDRFDLVQTYGYKPSLLVRLNQAQLPAENETESVQLYRAR